MTNTNTATGAICVYADFREQARKPRRTERAQREEIERSLDRLTQTFGALTLSAKRQPLLPMTTQSGSALLICISSCMKS